MTPPFRQRYLIPPLAVLALMMAAAPVLAWSVGTHAYIAERCLPQYAGSPLMRQAVYGAMLPDMESACLLLAPDQVPAMRELTHTTMFRCDNGCPEQMALVAGLLCHGERCGADVCAHLRNPLDPDATTGYVRAKAALITELSPGAAHFCVETAIDILVRRNLDPMIGRKVTEATQMRDVRVCDMLTGACPASISPKILIRAESMFRWTTAGYGDALNLPSPLDRYAGAALFSTLVTRFADQRVSFRLALRALDHAIAVCEPDYKAAIEETIRRVRASVSSPSPVGPVQEARSHSSHRR